MNKQCLNVIRQLAVPVYYIIFSVLYWKYARYQGVSVVEFGAVTAIGTGLAWLGWFWLNKPRKGWLIASASLAVFLLIAQLAVYKFLSIVPTGWENLR